MFPRDRKKKKWSLFKNKLENDKHHYKVGNIFQRTHFRTLGDVAGTPGYGPEQF